MPLSKITTASISTDASTSNTSIDNGTLFIDVTNNRAGIGTTSPEQALHVKSTNGQILAESTSNSNSPSLKLKSSTNNRDWELFSWATGSGQFGIYDGVAGLNRFLIDTSGRVTKPYQPAFHAGNNNGGSYLPLTTSAFPFNTTRINVGSHFNTSTYRFTAPVAGVYAFYYNIFYEGSLGSQHDSAFFVNGSVLTSGSGTIDQISSRYSTIRTTVHHSTIISLSVNDYVDVRARSDSSGNAVFGPHSSFGGYLLG